MSRLSRRSLPRGSARARAGRSIRSRTRHHQLRQRRLRGAAPVQRRLSGHLRLLHVHAGRAQRRSRLHERWMLRARAGRRCAAPMRRRCGRDRLFAPVRSRPVRCRHPGLRVRQRRVRRADLRRLPGQRQPVRDTRGVPGDVRGAAGAERLPRRSGRARRSASGAVPRAAARRSQTVCALAVRRRCGRGCLLDVASHLLRGRLPVRLLSLTTSARHPRDIVGFFGPIAWRRRARHIKCAFAHIKSLNGRLK